MEEVRRELGKVGMGFGMDTRGSGEWEKERGGGRGWKNHVGGMKRRRTNRGRSGIWKGSRGRRRWW